MPTKLLPNEEAAFKQWYLERAKKLRLDPNPDAPEHFYDYRGAYKEGFDPLQSKEAQPHWPSKYKQEGHPRTYLPNEQGKMMDTRTGKPVKKSMLDRLITGDTDGLSNEQLSKGYFIDDDGNMIPAIDSYPTNMGESAASRGDLRTDVNVNKVMNISPREQQDLKYQELRRKLQNK